MNRSNQAEIDTALGAISAIVNPQASLEECLDGLLIVRDELVVLIDAVRNDIERAQHD